MSPSDTHTTWIVEVWEPDGGDIASNRYVGPFRSKRRANEYAENVRALGRVLDARVVWLESGSDDQTWLALREWSDRSPV